MSRIVSVWLPGWPIDRLRRSAPRLVPEDRPFALVEKSVHGLRIHAASAPALAAGVRPGLALTDVRAALPALAVRPAETARDAAALQCLARWLGRYGPARNADGADGAWIDITGAAHLLGGEDGLLADLTGRLARLGITARAGLADTFGAAHALARFATTPARPAAGAAPGGMTAALAALPVAALRLAPDATHLLERLGLKRVGALYGLPRAALERRFRDVGGRRPRRHLDRTAAAVLLRLDQALGLTAEPRVPLAEPPETLMRLAFPEPLVSATGIDAAVARLADDLCLRLEALGQGARQFRLALYRTDGTLAEARLGTSAPARDAAHIRRLMAERLGAIDAGFGIDVMTLEARHLEALPPAQTRLAAAREPAADPALLIDRLTSRLGTSRVLRLAPAASHIPERSETARPALLALEAARPAAPASTLPAARAPRPPLLLPRPEPVSVVAEVPDGAPARLVWRRLARRIVRAEGPERIAPEWWRALALAEAERLVTRDYYRLEDETGAGYWVFRNGLYGCETERPPRWFLHGVWA
jgi:protein ImuB